MEKESGLYSLLAVFSVFLILFFGVVSASPTVSVSAYNSTAIQATISGADNVYGYEVNLDYTGSISSAEFSTFLTSGGGTQTTGHKEKSWVSSVYASRLDSTQTGVSGSGTLFYLTYTGSAPTLRDSLFVSTTGTETAYTPSSATITASATSTGSSGGGGGVGGIVVPASDVRISLSQEELSVNVLAGKEDKVRMQITNLGSVDIALGFEQEGLDGIISLPGNVGVKAGQTASFEIGFYGVDKALRTGTIYVKSGTGVVKSIPTVVNVRTENFLFDVSISIPLEYKKLLTSDILFVQIDLAEVRALTKVDVVATYVIKDFSGNVFLEETETFYVEEDKEFVKEFDLSNIGLKSGRYILGLEIVYPGAFATSSAQFEVQNQGFGALLNLLKTYWIAVLIAGIAILILLIMIRVLTRRRIIRKVR